MAKKRKTSSRNPVAGNAWRYNKPKVEPKNKKSRLRDEVRRKEFKEN